MYMLTIEQEIPGRGKRDLRAAVAQKDADIASNDVAVSALYTPPLTTIHQPMEEMGTMAAGIVVDAINGVIEKRSSGAVHRKLAPELVVRESTRTLS